MKTKFRLLIDVWWQVVNLILIVIIFTTYYKSSDYVGDTLQISVFIFSIYIFFITLLSFWTNYLLTNHYVYSDKKSLLLSLKLYKMLFFVLQLILTFGWHFTIKFIGYFWELDSDLDFDRNWMIIFLSYSVLSSLVYLKLLNKYLINVSSI